MLKIPLSFIAAICFAAAMFCKALSIVWDMDIGVPFAAFAARTAS
jgi:hypothetical protein